VIYCLQWLYALKIHSKDIDAIFSEVLVIMGNATKSNRAYYYENNQYQLISQNTVGF
jgi:hypothetical protein